jgi:hypothetical protein
MCDYPNARRLVVYHDGFDDLRAWMEELHIEEDVSDPPGALMPLLESVEMGTLTERIGPDRMEAFVTKLRQEEIELLQGRHLVPARRAPRRPEVDQYHLAVMVGQADRAPVGPDCPKILGGLGFARTEQVERRERIRRLAARRRDEPQQGADEQHGGHRNGETGTPARPPGATASARLT